MNNNENPSRHQEILLHDRERLSITCVEDVQSFDENSIIIKTGFGMMAVDGESLRIDELSTETGKISIEGRIGGVLFFEPSEKKKKRGFLG